MWLMKYKRWTFIGWNRKPLKPTARTHTHKYKLRWLHDFQRLSPSPNHHSCGVMLKKCNAFLWFSFQLFFCWMVSHSFLLDLEYGKKKPNENSSKSFRAITRLWCRPTKLNFLTNKRTTHTYTVICMCTALHRLILQTSVAFRNNNRKNCSNLFHCGETFMQQPFTTFYTFIHILLPPSLPSSSSSSSSSSLSHDYY